MEKTAQFITMVQTALIVKFATDAGDRSLARPIWAMQHLQTAYDVAGNIPADVTALEAAEVFIPWVLKQPGNVDQKGVELLAKLLGEDSN